MLFLNAKTKAILRVNVFVGIGAHDLWKRTRLAPALSAGIRCNHFLYMETLSFS